MTYQGGFFCLHSETVGSRAVKVVVAGTAISLSIDSLLPALCLLFRDAEVLFPPHADLSCRTGEVGVKGTPRPLVCLDAGIGVLGTSADALSSDFCLPLRTTCAQTVSVGRDAGGSFASSGLGSAVSCVASFVAGIGDVGV
jgi:hypothetical protein